MYKISTYSDKPLCLEAIRQLFLSSFGRELDEHYWSWRFLNNPFDESPRIVYAEKDSELAAYYAVSPVLVTVNGKSVKAALSNMTMTHPKHQGNGLFKKLANTLYDELRNDGFSFVFGFANSNSHYGFKKYLGWKDLSILNRFSLESSANLEKNTENKELVAVDMFSESDAKLFGNSGPSVNNIKVIRNADYLAWRFIENPENKYYIAKFGKSTSPDFAIIFKPYQNSIDIMEIMDNSPSADGVQKYLIGFLKYFFEKDFKSISIWSNLHSTEHSYLEKMGFRESNFMTYFGVIPLLNQINLQVLDYSNWHYRYSDSDIY